MSPTPIYSLRVPEIFKTLETSPQGLTNGEAESRLGLYGDNVLSEQKRPSNINRVVQQVRHPFVLIMLLASILSLFQGDWALALMILFLTLANGAFSFWREYRAEEAIEKLKRLLPSYAHLLRDGVEVHIPSSEIVPGDLIVLAEGDNIAADARVIEEYGLRVNNASLTGESVATRKTADPSIVPQINELERPNLIFAGTSVVSGTAKAIVFSTGMMTQFGRIAKLTQSVREEPSKFQMELEKLSRILAIIAFFIGAMGWVLATYDLRVSIHFPRPLLLALGIIVAVVPEGLPATLTLSLAMAVQRLTGKGVLAKSLQVVEKLGNVSVICTDKSGTLTQNQMTVREIWVARKRFSVTGVGYEPKGEFRPSPLPKDKEIKSLLVASMCCNNARINPPNPEHPYWNSLGDQTEAAMKVAAMKMGMLEDVISHDFPRVHEIPFDAHRKRMSTIHRTPEGEIAFVKGAPKEILQLCDTIYLNDSVQPLTNEICSEIITANDDFAKRALRVLAVAQRKMDNRVGPYSSDAVEKNLTFLGLMAMMDPPRPEVEKAISVCHRAGIRLVMITGDYGLTAESMARRIGLITSSNTAIITGSDLDEMSDLQIQRLLDEEVLFARMAPDHKLRLVSLFQSRGETVAVTGDGVNDAPAMRKADVGIAMGIIGTDVAKEAADIILTNDNFGSITDAIEEGRAIFDNIRKFMTYIFSGNVSEVFSFLLTSLIGIPPALNVRQVLVIDMGTDILPALALGTEKPEPDIMDHPPRKAKPLLDRSLLVRSFLWLGLLETILCYLGYLSIYAFSGNINLLNVPFLSSINWPHLLNITTDVKEVAKTVFLTGVVLAQIGNSFACRTYKARNVQMGWSSNKLLLLSALISILLIIGMIYLPMISQVFDNRVFPTMIWVLLIFYAPVIYTFEWFRKLFSRWLDKSRSNRKHITDGKEAL